MMSSSAWTAVRRVAPASRAVLFDLFGTLVAPQDRRIVVERMAEMLGVDEQRLDVVMRESFDQRIRGALGDLRQTLHTLALRAGASPDQTAMERAAALRIEMTQRQLDVGRPVLDALDALRRGGLRLGLVSDCTAETPLAWSHSPLASRFAVTVFSCELGWRKPDPRTYAQATDRLGVRPEECVYVGDGGSRELSGAASLGMSPVRVLRPGEPPGGPYEHDTTFVGPAIVTLAELPSLLGLWSGVR